MQWGSTGQAAGSATEMVEQKKEPLSRSREGFADVSSEAGGEQQDTWVGRWEADARLLRQLGNTTWLVNVTNSIRNLNDGIALR